VTQPTVLHTDFCDLVGARYPIVQTGMGWVSGARLTAATSQAGAFGILAAATMTFDELAAAIDAVQSRTSAPFGVNLRADQADVQARVKLLVDRGVRLASFAGAPRRDLIDSLKTDGVLTMPTIGAPRHAEKMAEWGVDALIAQGHEGGGHTGPVPTSILLPTVTAMVDIPVLGAGGFRDGRGLVAALAWGASGIAMGTRFLLTQESTVPAAVKAEYLSTKVTETVVTRAIDGHPQRVIATPVVRSLESASVWMRVLAAIRHGLAFRSVTRLGLFALLGEAARMRKTQDLTWSQLLMAANAPMLTRESLVKGRLDSGILPTGQVVGAIDELPTVAELVQRVITEATETLEKLR
jgi:NAD(P)H-dependent flavin oxidoreductase YrpB (nitropropane dioxygenase family)